MEPFEIPARTFTSFRLAYLRAQDVSETSKCIFLGSLPHIWIHDESFTLASGPVKSHKRNVRNTIEESVNRISDNYRLLSGRMAGNQSKLDSVISDIKQQYLEAGESEDEVENDEVYSEFSMGDDMEVVGDLASLQVSDTTIDQVNLKDISSETSPTATANAISPTASHTTNHTGSHASPVAYTGPESNGHERVANGTIGSNNKPHENASFDSPAFVENKPEKHRSSRSKPIHLAHPEPTTVISDDLITEKEQHRLRKRLKSLTKFSKGKAKKTTNDIRYRIHRTIIRKFKAGEIILREKGLVLTKETINAQSFGTFEENEPCDTRVYERWREYSIVLRKTDDDSVSLQFYRLESHEKKHSKQKKTSDFKEVSSDKEESGDEKRAKPEYEYKLTSQLKADIYSSVDKSISISVPKNNWCMIHIIRFHYQIKSYRWLYFIKQVTGDTLNTNLDISIPDLNMTVSLNIPENIFLNSFKECETTSIQQLEKDYKYHHSSLLEYALDTVQKELGRSKTDFIKKWLKDLDKPWFCFRDYDRLEWVFDDSEMFFIQNQLLHGQFQLELRNLSSVKKHVELQQMSLTEPYPIEGFLARLTNVRGYEQSILRTFYKISYFNTSDNLIFFTKYYRGMPPRATTELEDMYEHCSFPLDENHHIPWLNTEEYSKQDRLALEEFERKSHLLLKADSVIDLTSVISIKPVPLSKIKLAHKVLLSILWYGSSTIIDDNFILDSSFEITTMNAGKIRLQAPNKKIRDEWIRRLLEIRDYWVTKKQLEIATIDKVRAHNMKTLNINEYIDSNINQESSSIEMRYSKADPFVNSIDGTALTNNLLMSGYLYQKPKKHSNFNQYFAILSSGSLILYSLYKRSKLTGEWRRASYFQHYITIPLIDCYLYSGSQTSFDLLDRNQNMDPANPGHKSLSRIYVDGWKSSDEESMRCFTLWFGAKRSISHNSKSLHEPKNPSLISMVRKLGITGQSIVFMARSRQERELWVTRIYIEIDRHRKIYNL